MIHQMFIGKSGMFAYQRWMQVTTSNIANAQTVGFKKSRLELESLFPLVLERNISEFEDVNIPSTQKRKRYITYGQGVRIADVAKDFSQGTIEVTNQQLDLAIEGKGFLQFRLPDGTVAYSRAGNLRLDRDGNVLNPSGHPLEPALRIPQDVAEVAVTEDGRVLVKAGVDDVPREIGQIQLARFANPVGLREMGQNLYKETGTSGEPVLENPQDNGMGAIRQGALEFSNTNVIEELFRMILTQRTYEMITKAIQSGDKMLTVASEITR